VCLMNCLEIGGVGGLSPNCVLELQECATRTWQLHIFIVAILVSSEKKPKKVLGNSMFPRFSRFSKSTVLSDRIF
jgi:hypothetical protein